MWNGGAILSFIMALGIVGCGAEAPNFAELYPSGGAGSVATGGDRGVPIGTGGATAPSTGATLATTGGTQATGGDSVATGSSTASSGGVLATGGSVAGSGGTSSASGGTDAGVPPVGGDAWGPGDYPSNLMAEEYLDLRGVPGQGGRIRQYKVRVPKSYDPATPIPLVFCIHGLAQTPVLFCLNGTKMHEKAEEYGYVLVMPLGYQNSWNAGSCCGGASNERLDDVALFRALLEEVATHVNVDRERVFATGLSTGGYMSYRLACDAADMLRAVAPGAGAIGINSIGGGPNPASDFTVCEPSRPLSILDTHGTADGLVSYALKAPTLELLQEAFECDVSPGVATAPASAGDTSCVSYSGCKADVEVTACTVTNGGHCWFGSEDCGTGGGPIGMAFVGNNSDTLDSTSEVWEFFKRHTD